MDDPPTIYHYTDAAGLLGVVGGSSQWLSHIAFLSDSAEYTYATERYQQALDQLIEDPATREDVRLEAKTSRSEAKYAIAQPPETIFVASYSAQPDDLGQWRGYSGTGARYCIAFDFPKLQRVATHHGLGLRKVDYGEDRALDRAKAAFIEIYDEVVEHRRQVHGGQVFRQPNGSVFGGAKAQFLLHSYALAGFAPWCKHSAFDREEEWRLGYVDLRGRLVARPRPTECKTLYRPGRSFIVPYVEISLNEPANPIVSIMIGPSAHMDVAVSAVEGLLRSKGLQKSVKVTKSNIPYRDW